ncbi:MAG TPA: putative sulfate exporter family transporter [Hydrogenophaga sp.]|nr:putative sulfate exporter family transporter [Hydrogenophaga sp.]
MKHPRGASRHPLKGAALAVRQSRPGGAPGWHRFMWSGWRSGTMEIWHTRTDHLARLWPGVALCVVIALAAALVSNKHGGPAMLYSLLMGAAFHYQSHDPRTAPGVDACMRVILRLGIGLLGARITVDQIQDLGWITGLIVLTAVISTVLCGLLVARLLRQSWSMGLLAGGATAICGAAAALAIAAVLPHDEYRERNTMSAVVLATVLSTVAMLVYPLIASALALPPQWAGLFIGGTIHDVAQVVVAGYSLGPETGDVASIVKLLRVGLLVGVVAVIAMVVKRLPSQAASAPTPRKFNLPVPAFLLLFIGLVGVQSAGWMVAPLQLALEESSHACLMVGVTALGMKTSLSGLARTGWRPSVLMLGTSLWIALFVLVAIEVAMQR